jgi:hypothetical protein
MESRRTGWRLLHSGKSYIPIDALTWWACQAGFGLSGTDPNRSCATVDAISGGPGLVYLMSARTSWIYMYVVLYRNGPEEEADVSTFLISFRFRRRYYIPIPPISPSPTSWNSAHLHQFFPLGPKIHQVAPIAPTAPTSSPILVA